MRNQGAGGEQEAHPHCLFGSIPYSRPQCEMHSLELGVTSMWFPSVKWAQASGDVSGGTCLAGVCVQDTEGHAPVPLLPMERYLGTSLCLSVKWDPRLALGANTTL